MTRLHVGLEQDQIVAGVVPPQPRDPLGRLPVGDARIGQARIGEDMRVGLGPHVVVGRIGADAVEILLGGDRVAPFRATPAALAARFRRAWC